MVKKMELSKINSECVVKNGYLYLPLLYSPEIYIELNHGKEQTKTQCETLEKMVCRETTEKAAKKAIENAAENAIETAAENTIKKTAEHRTEAPIQTAEATAIFGGPKQSIFQMPIKQAFKETYLRMKDALLRPIMRPVNWFFKMLEGLDEGTEENKERSNKTKEKLPEEIIVVDHQKYIMTINLESLAENFQIFEPQKYEEIKKEIVEQSKCKIEIKPIDPTLEVLVFNVLPRLITPKEKIQKITPESIIDYINEQVRIPPQYFTKANQYLGIDDARATLNKTMRMYGAQYPENRKMSPTDANNIFKAQIARKIIKKEDAKLVEALGVQKELMESGTKRIATLLYIKENGIDLNGVGINAGSGPYAVYQKIEEYALMDFDKKSVYYFPACSVAVNISSINNPLIIESYTHPFLSSTYANQVICIRHRDLGRSFTAENVLAAIEAGTNTMLYGYMNPGNFNGYHKLGCGVGTPINKNDPRIKSGKLIITNEAFI